MSDTDEILTLAQKIRGRADWLTYYYGRRRMHRLFLSAIWKLPEGVVYWCVIRAAVRVNRDSYPGEVTAEQMLKAWSPEAGA